jgi:hypothetical protein
METRTENFATPYNQGYRDGAKAERERQQAAVEAGGSMSAREWAVQISLECVVAWLENGRDTQEAVVELRRDIALLRGHGTTNQDEAEKHG